MALFLFSTFVFRFELVTDEDVPMHIELLWNSLKGDDVYVSFWANSSSEGEVL